MYKKCLVLAISIISKQYFLEDVGPKKIVSRLLGPSIISSVLCACKECHSEMSCREDTGKAEIPLEWCGM